jgi:hypothetical protein
MIPIKQRMGRYAPMFVHVQYHEYRFPNIEYIKHKYNSNEDQD